MDRKSPGMDRKCLGFDLSRTCTHKHKLGVEGEIWDARMHENFLETEKSVRHMINPKMADRQIVRSNK